MKRRGDVKILLLRAANLLTLVALLAIAWYGYRRAAREVDSGNQSPEAEAAAGQSCDLTDPGDELPGENATNELTARIAQLSQALNDERLCTAEGEHMARRAIERARRWRERLGKKSETEEGNAGGQAVIAPAPEAVNAKVHRRGNRLDIELEWSAPRTSEPIRFEIWRWASERMPSRLAADLELPHFLDIGLPGENQVGYVIYSVTPGRAFSTSEGRAVLVDLPPVHEVELLEPSLEDRIEPPPMELPTRAPARSTERPERVRMRIRRLEDGQMETLEVKPGERVGSSLQTAYVLVETRWVECRRPVRYLEPVFQPDGRVVLEGGKVKRRARTLNLPVLLPEVVLQDGWDRRIRLSPPAVPGAIDSSKTGSGASGTATAIPESDPAKRRTSKTFRAGTDRRDR